MMTAKKRNGAALLALVVVGLMACEKPPPSEQEIETQVQALVDASNAKSVIAQATKAVEEAKKHPPLTPIATAPESKHRVLSIMEAHDYDQKPVPIENDCALYASHSEVLNRAVGRPSGAKLTRFDIDHTKELIEDLGRVTSVLVCRSSKVVPVKVLDATSFDGGTYQGECRLFDLETTKYLGGFEVKAQLDSAYSRKGKDSKANDFGTALGSSIGEALSNALFGKQTQEDQCIGMYCKFAD